MIPEWLNLIMMLWKWTPGDEEKVPGGRSPGTILSGLLSGGWGHLSVAGIPQDTIMQGQTSQATGVTLSPTTCSREVADLIPDCVAPMLGFLLSTSGGIGPSRQTVFFFFFPSG